MQTMSAPFWRGLIPPMPWLHCRGSGEQPWAWNLGDEHLVAAAVKAVQAPHLNCHVSTTAAGIDFGVVVHVVPGSRRKVCFCGDRALVHDGRYQQCITCAVEAPLSLTLATEAIASCMIAKAPARAYSCRGLGTASLSFGSVTTAGLQRSGLGADVTCHTPPAHTPKKFSFGTP